MDPPLATGHKDVYLEHLSHSIGAAAAVVVCGYIMGSMGRDLSGNTEIIQTIAANLNLDPSNSEHMKTILRYASHWDAWKWCFWLPACLAVCGALWLYVGLRDDPRSVGLPNCPAPIPESQMPRAARYLAHGKFLKANGVDQPLDMDSLHSQNLCLRDAYGHSRLGP